MVVDLQNSSSKITTLKFRRARGTAIRKDCYGHIIVYNCTEYCLIGEEMTPGVSTTEEVWKSPQMSGQTKKDRDQLYRSLMVLQYSTFLPFTSNCYSNLEKNYDYPTDSETFFDMISFDNFTPEPAFESYSEANSSQGSPIHPEAERPQENNRPQSCSVCADKAEGFHFGALACAACGAFFRRSISGQKVYNCPTRKCSIRHGSEKRRGLCRYCRFEKCLRVGMKSHEVQIKRCRRESGESTSSSKQNLSFPVFSNTSTLEAFVEIRRDMAFHRLGQFVDTEHCDLLSQMSCMDSEFSIFQRFIVQNPLFSELFSEESGISIGMKTEKKWWNLAMNSPQRDLFFTFFLFEIISNTSVQGGVQKDQCILQNGAHIDISHGGLLKFFDGRIQDPACMARLSSHFFSHLARVCARSIQAARLDEIENAFLFYIVLSQSVSTTTTNKLCSTLFKEISSHYDFSDCEISIKLGNLMLLASPILQALNYFKEYVSLIGLSRL